MYMFKKLGKPSKCFFLDPKILEKNDSNRNSPDCKNPEYYFRILYYSGFFLFYL